MRKPKIVLIISLLLAIFFCASTVSASFRGFLQEDTGVTVCVGPFIDMASANTPYTTSVVGTAVFISKNGGAPAAKNDPGALSASGSSGYMLTHLDATDTSTPGTLVMFVQMDGFLMVDQSWQVMAPNPFGAFFGAASTTYLNTGIATSGVTVSGMTQGALADLFDVDSGTSSAQSVPGSVVREIVENSGTTLSTVATEINRVIGESGVTVTNNNDKTGYSLVVDQSGVTIGWIAESGITAFYEHYLTGHLTENTAGKEIADGGAAGDPWSTTLPGAYGDNSAGKILGSGVTLAQNQDIRNVTGIVGSGVTVSDKTGFSLSESGVSDVAHNVWGDSDRQLTTLDEDNTSIDLNGTTIGTVSTLTGHTPQTADHTANIADILLDTGTDGVVLAANQDVRNATGIVGSGVTVSDKTGFSLASPQTFDLTGDITGNLSGSVASVSGNVGGNVTGSVGSVSGDVSGSVANVTGIVGSGVTVSDKTGFSLSADGVAAVASGVTSAELTPPTAGAPTATPTVEKALMYPYTSWRNKSETVASGVSNYADDGTTIINKFLHSDDGSTYTKGEVEAP